MDSRPIIYMDSGVGGIPYYLNFTKRNPNETAHYLADRASFPYGPRKREELVEIVAAIVKKLAADFNPKIIVLACNTASISAIGDIIVLFPEILFVGTLPEVEAAAAQSGTGKVGVIATERTIADPFITQLAGESCQVTGIAAADLVEFVNNRFLSAGEKEKTEIVKKYTDIFAAAGVDSLVLGCTHFLFLKEEFVKAASPDIKVFDSVDSVTKSVENILDGNEGALRGGGGKKQGLFLITGTEEADELWKSWAAYTGCAVSIFGET